MLVDRRAELGCTDAGDVMAAVNRTVWSLVMNGDIEGAREAADRLKEIDWPEEVIKAQTELYITEILGEKK